jgi:hypothetical protein
MLLLKACGPHLTANNFASRSGHVRQYRRYLLLVALWRFSTINFRQPTSVATSSVVALGCCLMGTTGRPHWYGYCRPQAVGRADGFDMEHILPKLTQSAAASGPTSSISGKATPARDAASPVVRAVLDDGGTAPRRRLYASHEVLLTILGVGIVATVAWAVGLTLLFLKAVWWLWG